MSGNWILHNFLLVTLTSPQWSVTFYVRQLHKTHHTICPTYVSLALAAGDEGSNRPISSPCPPQLPPSPPLFDASMLAGWSRGPASLRLAPVLLGSAHQAPCLPQGRANSVRSQRLATACPKHIRGSRWWTICYIYGFSCSLFWHFPLYRSCSQPLLSPTPTDLSSVATVSDWLKALRMERYQDEFDQAHLDTLDRVSILTMEWVQIIITVKEEDWWFSAKHFSKAYQNFYIYLPFRLFFFFRYVVHTLWKQFWQWLNLGC